MKKEQKRIIEHYIESYNFFDVEGMLWHLHEEVVFENIVEGEVTLRIEGIEAFREQAIAANDIFRNRKQWITAWTFMGPVVKVDIQFKGYLAVDLPKGKKAGETLSMSGHTLFEFVDEKIIKIQDIS